MIDPADPSGDDLLEKPSWEVSEIAGAEAHFRAQFRRTGDTAALENAERVAALRRHPDLLVIDLDDDEREDAETFASDAFAEKMQHDGPLGLGEAAVTSLALDREWRAGIDERAARRIARAWDIPIVTTQDALRDAVRRLHISQQDAESVNARLIAGGFHGDQHLFPHN